MFLKRCYNNAKKKKLLSSAKIFVYMFISICVLFLCTLYLLFEVMITVIKTLTI